MIPQQFEQLIEKAKVVSDEEFSVTIESKHCNYEFEIYAETGNDFKVFVNQFGKNTKQGWVEFELTNVLNQLGIEFTKGNDAPRGGKTGAFVKITTKIK